MVEEVQAIAFAPSKLFSIQEFFFNLTTKTTDYSWTSVKKLSSLFNTINSQDGTLMELELKFRSVNTLVKVFDLHPLWEEISLGINFDFNYSLTQFLNWFIYIKLNYLLNIILKVSLLRLIQII